MLPLPLAQQVPVLVEAMHGYLDECRGDFPFFGWGRGFRFVRLLTGFASARVGS
jgi:hypothetical protein